MKLYMRLLFLFFLLIIVWKNSIGQIQDSIPPVQDTVLRIVNLDPFITLHADSNLNFKPEINKGAGKYFWYLRNAPVGMKINKDNGTINFRADKSYFLS